MPGPATSIPFEQTGLGRILNNPNRTSRDWIDAAFGSLGAQDRGNQAAGAALGLANELAGEENRRQGQTVSFLTEQFNRANASARPQPGQMAAMMGRATDAATGQSLDEWRGLRDYLGSAGVTGGGLAAGLGAQIELGRMAQVQGSKRDLAIWEAERQAQQASDQFLRSLQLGQVMNQSPSMLLLDQLNSTADRQTNLDLGRAQIGLGREQLRASRRAADQQFWGDLIGGGLGLGAGLLG